MKPLNYSKPMKHSAENTISQTKIEQSEKYKALVDNHLSKGGTITHVEMGMSAMHFDAYMNKSLEVIEKHKAREQAQRAGAARFEGVGV